MPDAYLAFPMIFVAQIIALLSSVKVKNLPDTPSATGTVNRVVKGVTIHLLKNRRSDMVVLTQEKRNLLEKLSRDGVISALAFDQRGALKRMMANYQTEEPSVEQIEQLKAWFQKN